MLVADAKIDALVLDEEMSVDVVVDAVILVAGEGLDLVLDESSSDPNSLGGRLALYNASTVFG